MNSRTIRFFVIDDEEGPRKELIETLTEDASVEVVGEAGSVKDAWNAILKTAPDALFLDIRLQGEEQGYDLLVRMREEGIEIPPVIIITGYLEFETARKAINEFRNCVIKILTKPYWDGWEENFQECKEAIWAYLRSKESIATLPGGPDVIFIRENNITHRIPVSMIDYLEVGGSGKTFLVIEDGRKVLAPKTLNTLLQELPSFITRVHRNNAINNHKIAYIDHDDHVVYLVGHKRGIGIGDVYYQGVLRMMRG